MRLPLPDFVHPHFPEPDIAREGLPWDGGTTKRRRGVTTLGVQPLL